MKLHFFTDKNAPYSFDYYIDIMSDEEFNQLSLDDTIIDILNSEDVLDCISDSDLGDLVVEAIDPMFDMSTNGMFDWNEKTGEYYDLFDAMLQELLCTTENDAGEIIKQFNCALDEFYDFTDSTFSFSPTNFYSGNGEPIGAQLALNIVDVFMKGNCWHIGFYDSNDNLITDIAKWSQNNILNIKTIKPIVWFGRSDEVSECWSLTPDTSDLFVKKFWGDYYEGALPFICKADDGIYYSTFEYGLEYDYSIFEEDIKNSCPINIDLEKEERANALFNLISRIYNENKPKEYPIVDNDIYLRDVIDCKIVVSSYSFNYSYTKRYMFNSNDLNKLNKDIIEDILREDDTYNESFHYLKDKIIDICNLNSCVSVWETVKATILLVQQQFNKSLSCHIYREEDIVQTVPFEIELDAWKIPMKEIQNVVFIKSLIEFFKRGRWHIGFKEASKLPQIRNAMAEVIEQNGTYPIVWFNDTEEIDGRMGIWPAQQQYMLSLTWENVSAFCSRVFLNNDVWNEYRYSGSALYKELETEFERVKSECPIHISNDKEPVDFDELLRVASARCK